MLEGTSCNLETNIIGIGSCGMPLQVTEAPQVDLAEKRALTPASSMGVG